MRVFLLLQLLAFLATKKTLQQTNQLALIEWDYMKSQFH